MSVTGTPKSDRQLADELQAFAETGESTILQSSFTPLPEKRPRIGFVMSGQGPQWWGMGRELMRTEPVFRRAMEQCAAAIDRHANFRLLEELAKGEDDTRLGETEVGQPAIFAMRRRAPAPPGDAGRDPAPEEPAVQILEHRREIVRLPLRPEASAAGCRADIRRRRKRKDDLPHRPSSGLFT